MKKKNKKQKKKQFTTVITVSKRFGDFWMVINSEGSVIICEQPRGDEPKQRLQINRRNFNALIAWYLRPQKQRKPSYDDLPASFS